jgi:zinc protease
MDRTLENVITMNVVKQVLDLVYMEKVREAEGGTYDVSTSVSISSFPKGRTLMQIYFDTDPAKRVRMNEIVHNELKSIAENGPRDVDFQKTVDNLLKRHAEMLQENSYWLNALDNYYFRGFDSVTNYEATVKSMTKDKVKAALSSLLSQGNNIEVVMEP